MITSLDIFLKIKQRLNKGDTQDDENFPPYVAVEAYNKACLNVISRIISKNNNYKTGLESTTNRVDDLQVLINDLPKKLNVSKKDNYFLTEKLPENYFRYIRVFCKGSKKGCEEKDITVFLQEESNLNTLLDNSTVNPSFEWRETIGTIANNHIKVFTLNTFNISNVFLTYIRKPIKIDIEGYIKQDGSLSTNINPDLPEDMIEMIIDEACRILSGDIQDQFSNQISQQNLQMSE
jgi:hypothetical protein